MTPRENRYLLLDGWHRLCIAKELVKEDKFWENIWCEDWKLTDKQANLLLATLNRLRGVDDNKKRGKLLQELYEQYDGDKSLLLKLLPESEKSFNAILKMADSDLDKAVEDLETEKGIVEDKLSQVVGPDEAQNMARLYKWQDDGKARITFVFDNEEEYFEALKYFGRKPDTIKLMELIGYNKQDA